MLNQVQHDIVFTFLGFTLIEILVKEALVSWQEAKTMQTATWQSVAGNPAPKKITPINDTLKADAAYKMACEGNALLWRGDFQNAKHLSQAISRRIDNRTTKPKAVNKAVKDRKAHV